MNEQQLRDKFVQYFADHGHTVVPSSSLVPHNDPTLLFTNAGMVQFKDIFLGLQQSPYKRAVTVQKCVRAGGKHNDLDAVGRTARHHTFFEMLGNFSFGDYFKREAIGFAWEFLTKELALPTDKLYITVYEDDDEARAIWREVTGFPDSRIYSMGKKDNFWSMGDTGPCGPCSEIFFDRGAEYSCDRADCGMGVCDCDRWMEIWNLVFMQYNRDAQGKLTPLPRPSIDTGMGLERIVSVMEQVASNYEIPLFQNLIGEVEKMTGKKYDKGENGLPFRVIADHLRSCTFLIADGVMPGNEGRGYVLRHILRRAVRFGKLLGMDKPFLYTMVPLLVQLMGTAYPEIEKQSHMVERVIRIEEERFHETLNAGLALLETMAEKIQKEERSQFSGEEAFLLYDTYGFPLDLTVDIAEEKNMTVDKAGFAAAMEEQRNRAREARKAGHNVADMQQTAALLRPIAATKFVGYDENKCEGKLLAVLRDGQLVESVMAGESGIAVLDCTPFYGESGGQVGDIGVITGANGILEIADTQKLPNNIYLHYFTCKDGILEVGETVQAAVDESRRMDIQRNHSATHLLHHALRKVLGEHVHQAGSLVTSEELRFDFSHMAPVSEEELLRVEEIANAMVLNDFSTSIRQMQKEAAIEKGAMALFGEKYGDTVRVVTMGDSVELCGGTHCSDTGQIGLIKVISETGIGSGLRRIEAITGMHSYQWMTEKTELLFKIGKEIKAPVPEIMDKVVGLQKELRQKEKEVEKLRAQLTQKSMGDLLDNVEEIASVPVLIQEVQAADMAALRNTMDMVKEKFRSGVLVLVAASGEKVNLVAAVSPDVLDHGLHAGNIVKAAAAACGGGGGGKADMAQAGGKDVSKIAEAMQAAKETIRQQLVN